MRSRYVVCDDVRVVQRCPLGPPTRRNTSPEEVKEGCRKFLSASMFAKCLNRQVETTNTRFDADDFRPSRVYFELLQHLANQDSDRLRLSGRIWSPHVIDYLTVR